MSPTKSDKNRHLRPEQETAVDLVLAGLSDREIAEKLGRNRQTIGEWRHEPAFVAAVNARRVELWGGSADRLRQLLPKAIEVLEGALESGDVRTALRIVDLAGFREQGGLGLSTIGPTTPEGVEAAKREQDFLDIIKPF